MERISTNSQTLKEKFPEVYREFFSRCHTVISLPCHFSWVGDLSGYYGCIQIIEKVPSRVYIGLSETNDQETITIESQCFCYSPNLQSFQLKRIDSISKSLDHALKSSLYQKLLEKGCRLHFLSEHSIRSGIIGYSPIAAGVFFCLSLFNNQISPFLYQQWSQSPIPQLKQDSILGFNKFFKQTWQFVETVKDSISTGVTTFNILVESKYPIIYFAENKQWQAFRLDELIPLPKEPRWPIDFGLIYSGNICQPIYISVDNKSKTDSIYSATEFVRKNAKKYFPKLPVLTEEMISSKEAFWSTYLRMFDNLALTIFYSIGNLLSQNINQKEFDILLAAINRHYDLFSFVGLSNITIKEVAEKIHRLFGHFGNRNEIAITSTGVGIGSEMLFVIPSHSYFKDKIDNVILSLREEYGSDVTLDYASWLDGYETEGIKIEQSLEHGIYSEFISRDAVEVKAYTSTLSSSPQIFLLSPEEFEREKAKIDLLLDERKNKIYLRGREMSSSELHSSKFTISVLKILLENSGREIKNRQLPDLSYRSNRYDLQGKITDPLKRALTKWTDKNFNLKISGGITDFSIKFWPGDLTIWFIEKK